MKRALILSLAGLLTAGAAAVAQQGTGGQVMIQLDSTAEGQEFQAQGLAMKSALRGDDAFAVRAFANLNEGAVLVVSVRVGKQTYDIGTIKMILGSGALVLKGDPSPEVPIHAISEVIVSYRGMVILTGRF